MIFRRRRTRIEIEQTTVTRKAGRPDFVAPRPVVVTPTARSPVESVLARVLRFPAPEPNEVNDPLSLNTIDVSTTHDAPTAKETRS